MRSNPFRIHGTVTGEFFADREKELDRFCRVLKEPTAKLVVYGYRRMGKSSTLEMAAGRVNDEGDHAIVADLSTASTIADLGNRILEGSARSLGRRWRDILGGMIDRFQGSITLANDPASGLLIPSFDISLREASPGKQNSTLAHVLNTIDALAEERGANIGLVLDEFQEILEVGGDRAEWRLRGIVQHHQNVSYIFAGSKPHLVRRMLGQGRAFYQLADEHNFGPIDPTHMAGWIDERMESVGLTAHGAGVRCVDVTGPRTRDIVEVARKCVDRADDGANVDKAAVEEAFIELIGEKDDGIRAWWKTLTPIQQNVLRAVAGTREGLTTAHTRKQFTLPGSGSVANTAQALVNDGRLVKTDNGSGYVFDSPFVRGWTVTHALPDIGLTLPPAFKASRGTEYGTVR